MMNALQRALEAAAEHFLLSKRPDVVIIAAGKVGGIHANSTLPAEFIYQNLMIAANLIHGAFRTDVRKLLFLGSSCIYPN
jgi:GDP-L-fucose synthase